MIEFTKDYSFHHTADTPRRDAFHRHMHNGYEILYFVRGDAEYIIEGSVYRLKPRDLLFIHPRTFHYLSPLTDTTYERFVIHFPEHLIPPSCLEFARASKNIYRVPRGSDIDHFFESWETAEGKFSENEMREYLYPSITSAMLYLHHLNSDESVKPIREHRTLESILRYIDEHPERQITAAELSQKFYVSTSFIVHTFRGALGISLMQYVEKKRILYAEAKIHAGMSPTDVAKLCNYENYSTFYRQYKKVLGHSPAEDMKN